ncbi:MAG: ThiF family adenylyltransferase [Planctomycetota bacterium]
MTSNEPARAERHARQVRFGPIGPEGQARLRESHVILVGLGATGSHAADALTRAGVGRLTLVDRDVVEFHNLQRQTLYCEADAADQRPKALAAAERLASIDSAVTLDARIAEFDRGLWDRLDPRPQLAMDCTDNFATRFLLNDLAVRDSVPWIYAGVVGSQGCTTAILPGVTPCLRCRLSEPPPSGSVATCETAGVFEPAVRVVAGLATATALRILTGDRDLGLGTLRAVDLWSGRWREHFADSRPRPECPTCGTRSFPALAEAAPERLRMCGRDTVQVRPALAQAVDFATIAARLRGVGVPTETSPHLLRFAVEGCRISLFRDGRALIFGTADPQRAASLYDRWLGG